MCLPNPHGRLAPAGRLLLPWEWPHCFQPPAFLLPLPPSLQLQSHLAELVAVVRARGAAQEQRGVGFSFRLGNEVGQQLPVSFEQVLT